MKSFFGFLLAGALSISWSAPAATGARGNAHTLSAKTIGDGRISIGVSLDMSSDEGRFKADSIYHHNTSDGTVSATKITELTDMTLRPLFSIGLSDYFDVGFAVPLHMDKINDAQGLTDAEFQADINASGSFAFGDVEVWGKLQYPPYEHDHFFDMALYGGVTIPTGDRSKGLLPKEVFYVPSDSGTPKFYAAEQLSGTILMLWTLDLAQSSADLPVELNLNYGFTTTITDEMDNAFILNSSLVVKPNEWVNVFADFSGKTRFSKFSQGYTIKEDPLTLSPGFTVNTPQGFFITAAMDFGLSAMDSTETIRLDRGPDPNKYSEYKITPVAEKGFTVVIGWEGYVTQPDTDKDGLKDNEDFCPKKAEDFDNFNDHDGCPDEDNDEDGVYDDEDKCPIDAEDKDGFQDEDGCPDNDNDNDGFKDAQDQCPNEAEDLNGQQDEDGCPDGGADRDGDKVVDLKDACPDTPEDFDGYKDNDGCPEADNDNDGFLDADDQCPNAAEIVNGYLDEDGCPDGDADPDGDGIVNEADKCPDKPEDMDGFEDEDGCPDEDNDKDNILDVNDKCPMEPETINNLDDTDGCPEADRDGDRILDPVDKCPAKPETRNGYQDNDGCPDEIPKKPLILKGVTFHSGKATLTDNAMDVLQPVIVSLKENPDAIIEIGGHTDSRGGNRANQKLSERRAQAVVEYLRENGIKCELRAKGYGEDQPIASNSSASGRRKNRRIEMKILGAKPQTTP